MANFFLNLRMEQNEVVMCRFLADLLDPDGWHGCKTKFLESFMKRFAALENVKKEDLHLERTCVMTEYLIDNGKRIDIMLQNPAFSIPIEVKINARDQQKQCYDYAPYARNAKLIYLTKSGDFPSSWSMGAVNRENVPLKEKIHPVSWSEICDWLDQETEPLEQIKQYADAVRSFLPKSEKREAILDLDLARNVLEAFRVEMDQMLVVRYNLEMLKNSYKSYQNWNSRSLNFCPGLNYCVRDVNVSENEKLQMWFRIEIADDGYLSAGFCLVNRDDGERGTPVNVNDSAAEAIEKVGGLRFILSRDYWWFVWRFSNGKQDVDYDDVPNFKTTNPCAEDLRNPAARNKFVKKTLQIFEDQLLQYLKSLPEQ